MILNKKHMQTRFLVGIVVFLEIGVEFWVMERKIRLAKYLRDSNWNIWQSEALLHHQVNYPIMHYTGASYPTRFFRTQTAFRFMLYHQPLRHTVT